MTRKVPQEHLTMREGDAGRKAQVIRLRLGDSFEILRDLEPNSIRAVVTDPPYG